jgi:hypothetical protein
MATQGDRAYVSCRVKETLLDQLCIAVNLHAKVACRLDRLAGRPEFVLTQANAARVRPPRP